MLKRTTPISEDSPRLVRAKVSIKLTNDSCASAQFKKSAFRLIAFTATKAIKPPLQLDFRKGNFYQLKGSSGTATRYAPTS